MGKAFGFHRALDTAGAVLGPLAAILLVNYLAATTCGDLFHCPHTRGHWRPALDSIGPRKTVHPKINPPQFKLSAPYSDYKLFLVVIAIFAVGNSSDAFLILRAQNLGLSTTNTILAYVGSTWFISGPGLYGRFLERSDRPQENTGGGLFSVCLDLSSLGPQSVCSVDLGIVCSVRSIYGAHRGISQQSYITTIANPDIIATFLRRLSDHPWHLYLFCLLAGRALVDPGKPQRSLPIWGNFSGYRRDDLRFGHPQQLG